MNIERGLRRLSYVFLGLVWLLFIAMGVAQGAATLGEYIVGLLLFTLGYMALFASVRWAIRGFVRDPQ